MTATTAPAPARDGSAAPKPAPGRSPRQPGTGRPGGAPSGSTGGPRLSAVRPRPGPHGRLGVLFVGVTAGAVAGGPWALAAWLSLCVALAGVEVARSWRPRGVRPAPGLTVLGPVAATLASAGGWLPFAVTMAAVVALAALPRRRALLRGLSTVPGPAEEATPAVTAAVNVAAPLALGLAAASVVLTREVSVTAVAILLTLVWCHDAGRYIVGWGAPAPWEGMAAGVATIGAAALALAVVQPSPFGASAPWLAGVVAAVAVTPGPWAAGLLVGEPSARVPALRRLDSLLLVAPLWAALTAARVW
ncbi:MAG TPA: hypothetical protein VFH45_00485 [Acidimicrobiales bacterium]|nr:hypothetical protein [Acidimicrobiales bacterium]